MAKKDLQIKAPTPNPKDGKAVVRIVERLAPTEKVAADASRDKANQNPAK